MNTNREPVTAGEAESPWDSEGPGTLTLPDEAIKRRDRRRMERLWYVILHDDNDHSYEYVIEMLMKLFDMTGERAYQHACEVDKEGVTIVARLPKDQAADKRDHIMRYGGDPRMKTRISMKASIEPCDD